MSLADSDFLVDAAHHVYGGTRKTQHETTAAGKDGGCGNHVLWHLLVKLGVARE